MRIRTVLASASLTLAIASCGSVSSTVDKSGEPAVSMVSPDHGGIAGGEMVTLMGSHFSGGTPIVLVGGHAATNVMAVSDTQITFTSPPGEDTDAGQTVDVTVANSHGFGTKEASFTFNPPVVALSITPPNGKSTGGTNVTITGRGFMGGTPTVMLAGAPATNVMVVSDTTITATSAAAPSGTLAFVPLDVVVSNQNGTSTLPKAYSVSKPGLIAIGPTSRCCGPDAVVYVDPTTGSVARLSTTTVHAHGCTMDANGVMYVIGTPTGTSTNARALYSVDPISGTSTMIGALNDSSNVNHNLGSLTFDGNTLYGLDTGNNVGTPTLKLVSINPQSGMVTLIGNAMTVGNNNAIAAKDAANVYVADSMTGSLDTVAVATGARSAGLAWAGGPNDLVHGLVNTGSTLFVASRAGRNVYSVTMGASATLTVVANVPGVSTLSGLCPTPPSF